jgi:hypothetical protein
VAIKRLGVLSIALATAFVPTVTLAAQASGAASQAGKLNWNTYFDPQRVGFTCDDTFSTPTTSGAETLTVSAVKQTAQGKAITIEESGITHPAGGGSVPTNETLHYTITPSGDLVSTPSSLQFGAQSGNVVGQTILPNVASMLAGHRSTYVFKISIPLSKADLAQVGSTLRPHQTALKISIEMANHGSAVPTLSVPFGTFHQVLRIDTTMKKVTVTNAITADAGKQIGSVIESQFKQGLNATTWYAPGVGPIQVFLNGLTTVTKSCTG